MGSLTFTGFWPRLEPNARAVGYGHGRIGLALRDGAGFGPGRILVTGSGAPQWGGPGWLWWRTDPPMRVARTHGPIYGPPMIGEAAPGPDEWAVRAGHWAGYRRVGAQVILDSPDHVLATGAGGLVALGDRGDACWIATLAERTQRHQTIAYWDGAHVTPIGETAGTPTRLSLCQQYVAYSILAGSTYVLTPAGLTLGPFPGVLGAREGTNPAAGLVADRTGRLWLATLVQAGGAIQVAIRPLDDDGYLLLPAAGNASLDVVCADDGQFWAATCNTTGQARVAAVPVSTALAPLPGPVIVPIAPYAHPIAACPFGDDGTAPRTIRFLELPIDPSSVSGPSICAYGAQVGLTAIDFLRGWWVSQEWPDWQTAIAAARALKAVPVYVYPGSGALPPGCVPMVQAYRTETTPTIESIIASVTAQVAAQQNGPYAIAIDACDRVIPGQPTWSEQQRCNLYVQLDRRVFRDRPPVFIAPFAYERANGMIHSPALIAQWAEMVTACEG